MKTWFNNPPRSLREVPSLEREGNQGWVSPNPPYGRNTLVRQLGMPPPEAVPPFTHPIPEVSGSPSLKIEGIEGAGAEIATVVPTLGPGLPRNDRWAAVARPALAGGSDSVHAAADSRNTLTPSRRVHFLARSRS